LQALFGTQFVEGIEVPNSHNGIARSQVGVERRITRRIELASPLERSVETKNASGTQRLADVFDE
jgi:hypothetical protein